MRVYIYKTKCISLFSLLIRSCFHCLLKRVPIIQISDLPRPMPAASQVAVRHLPPPPNLPTCCPSHLPPPSNLSTCCPSQIFKSPNLPSSNPSNSKAQPALLLPDSTPKIQFFSQKRFNFPQQSILVLVDFSFL